MRAPRRPTRRKGPPPLSMQTEPLLRHVHMRKVGELEPPERNARTHSPRQIEKIAASIEQLGFVNPI